MLLGNLMQQGPSIELVSCPDGRAASCAAISPPLGYGDFFSTDLPGSNFTFWVPSFDPTRSGPGFGYRQVPAAAVPAPAIWSFTLNASAYRDIVNNQKVFASVYAAIALMPVSDDLAPDSFN